MNHSTIESDSNEEKASLMEKAFLWLFPPGISAANRWRIFVFIALMLMFGHVAIACGWLDHFGVSGFAYSSDVATLRGDVVTLRTENLEQQLFDTRVRQCGAQSTEPRRFYLEKFQELLRRYKELTGGDYRAPGCPEL